MQTYYDILGVQADCEEEEIKAAFRKLALAYHPDHNPEGEGEEQFLEIREAYETLIDPERRAEYDVFLVETHPDYEYLPGHAPPPKPKPPESGPRQSGGRGFGFEPEDEVTPFMFLVWLLPPIIIAGLLQEFVGEPILTLGSVPVVLLGIWMLRNALRE